VTENEERWENSDMIVVKRNKEGYGWLAIVKAFGHECRIRAIFPLDLLHQLGHVLLALTDGYHNVEG